MLLTLMLTSHINFLVFVTNGLWGAFTVVVGRSLVGRIAASSDLIWEWTFYRSNQIRITLAAIDKINASPTLINVLPLVVFTF